MSKRRFLLFLTPLSVGAMWATSSTATTPEIACEMSGVPTITASFRVEEQEQNVPILSFLPEYFAPEAAARHCGQTAQMLQSLYQQEEVQYLVSDRLGSRSAVCAVERRGVGCDSYGAHVLFTFNSDVAPNTALYNMLGSELKPAQPPTSRTGSRLYTSIEQSTFTTLLQMLF